MHMKLVAGLLGAAAAAVLTAAEPTTPSTTTLSELDIAISQKDALHLTLKAPDVFPDTGSDQKVDIEGINSDGASVTDKTSDRLVLKNSYMGAYPYVCLREKRKGGVTYEAHYVTLKVPIPLPENTTLTFNAVTPRITAVTYVGASYSSDTRTFDCDLTVTQGNTSHTLPRFASDGIVKNAISQRAGFTENKVPVTVTGPFEVSLTFRMQEKQDNAFVQGYVALSGLAFESVTDGYATLSEAENTWKNLQVRSTPDAKETQDFPAWLKASQAKGLAPRLTLQTTKGVNAFLRVTDCPKDSLEALKALTVSGPGKLILPKQDMNSRILAPDARLCVESGASLEMYATSWALTDRASVNGSMVYYTDENPAVVGVTGGLLPKVTGSGTLTLRNFGPWNLGEGHWIGPALNVNVKGARNDSGIEFHRELTLGPGCTFTNNHKLIVYAPVTLEDGTVVHFTRPGLIDGKGDVRIDGTVTLDGSIKGNDSYLKAKQFTGDGTLVLKGRGDTANLYAVEGKFAGNVCLKVEDLERPTQVLIRPSEGSAVTQPLNISLGPTAQTAPSKQTSNVWLDVFNAPTAFRSDITVNTDATVHIGTTDSWVCENNRNYKLRGTLKVAPGKVLKAPGTLLGSVALEAGAILDISGLVNPLDMTVDTTEGIARNPSLGTDPIIRATYEQVAAGFVLAENAKQAPAKVTLQLPDGTPMRYATVVFENGSLKLASSLKLPGALSGVSATAKSGMYAALESLNDPKVTGVSKLQSAPTNNTTVSARPEDVLTLFSGVASAVADKTGPSAVVTVTYDFGIDEMKAVPLGDRSWIVLAARVQTRDGQGTPVSAAYAPGTAVEVLDSDGSPVADAEELTADERTSAFGAKAPVDGVKYFKVPLPSVKKGLKVRATSAAL